MIDSKEFILFYYLKEILDFDMLLFKRVTIISSPTLAQTTSNYRRVMIDRMKNTPQIFKKEQY